MFGFKDFDKIKDDLVFKVRLYAPDEELDPFDLDYPDSVVVSDIFASEIIKGHDKLKEFFNGRFLALHGNMLAEVVHVDEYPFMRIFFIRLFCLHNEEEFEISGKGISGMIPNIHPVHFKIP